MKPQAIKCPSCGATHDVLNPGVVTVVCEYCGNAVYWDEDKLRDAGQQSILPEGFTRLFRGATGRLDNRRFAVMGRVRYSFGKGFWDEWFLTFDDGTIGWLTEDNHELALQQRSAIKKPPAFEAMKPGRSFKARGIDFVFQEVGRAECIGVEGDLPIAVKTGETYQFADASSPDGRHTFGIEYDADPPTVFVGRWLTYADLTLDDEGLDW
ncbi:MAG: DUF4178 domain-containing protein [Desulfobacterales bacterium]|nr:DUF4178 domain-containing protein [Desulfobacterales bacterium]MDJ0801745.1 DUF4178 domain-containing protein [Desulfobacterales bacterium]